MSLKAFEPGDAETRLSERISVPAPIAAQPHAEVSARALPQLVTLLLPRESVVFASRPHPIVFARPSTGVTVAAVALGLVLGWHAPLQAVLLQRALLAAAGLFGVWQVALLAKNAMYYHGLRVVATNRRIFLIRGVVGRRVTPLPYAALAGSTLAQGIIGRIFGFGDIDSPGGAGSFGRLRSLRDPVRLYREFQAVANGVDGDNWAPATRQTIIP